MGVSKNSSIGAPADWTMHTVANSSNLVQPSVVRDPANPESLMFGTDLPSTRAPTPFQDKDFELVAGALGEEAAKQVFSNNAIKFYNPAIS